MDLKNKVALITGAGRRIGRAIAIDLAAHGTSIAVHHNTSHTEAESVASEITTSGGKAQTFRANLEETGMGYGLEVDLVKAAAALDLLTTPYVFDSEQARDMTRAGADIVVCHMGLTAGGAIGAETAVTLEDCVPRINDWAASAKRARKDVIVLCHGGPIAMPEDAAFVLRECPDVHGFYGASSMERLPTEVAIAEQTKRFKRIARTQAAAQVDAD